MLTDNSPMPFGKAHKGKKMANVPASYLLWLYNEPSMQTTLTNSYPGLKAYIEDNLQGLQAEGGKNEAR